MGSWPVTADSGVLACDSFRGHAVTFTPAGSDTTFALNWSAIAWAPQQRWTEVDTISAGDDWRDLIDAGIQLCS